MTEIAAGQGDDRSPPVYAVGMEVPPQRWTRPAEDRLLPEWQPYYGLRFGRRTRLLLTVLVAFLPALFTLMAIDQLLLAPGEWRAAGVLFLMPLVVLLPVASMACRDLWGPHR